MNWLIDGKELRGTDDPAEIVSALNLCATQKTTADSKFNKYYLLQNDSNAPIISNVPKNMYKNENLKKYIVPAKVGTLNHFISDLQSYIDAVHYENGECFRLNGCSHNSKGVFYLVQNLSRIGAIKPKPINEIVLGYKVGKMPGGTVIGGIVVQKELLYVHDWHVWNYIDHFLIDLSLFQRGNHLGLHSNIQSWGRAKDHVFVYPSPGSEYFGNAYSDLKSFENKISEYFFTG
ncbi:MAG: hypothetical protein AB2L12_17570 [Smithellaceae bacterium]